MKNFSPSLTMLALTLLAMSCDIIEKDLDSTDGVNFRVVSPTGRSTVIDLSRSVANLNSVEISGQVGIESRNQLIKYDFSKQGEVFFKIRESGNKIINAKVSATQLNGESCTSEPFTYAKISNNETLVVNLLNNPEFCEYDIFSNGLISNADPRPGIDVVQNSEGIEVEVCACGSWGDHAILTYVPPKGFVGKVKYKYYIGVSKHDVILSSEDYYRPDAFTHFTAHEVEIEVVDAHIQ